MKSVYFEEGTLTFPSLRHAESSALTQAFDLASTQNLYSETIEDAAVFIRGYDVTFNNGDHNFQRLSTKLDLTIDKFRKKIVVDGRLLLRDHNGDDPYSGTIDYSLVVSVSYDEARVPAYRFFHPEERDNIVLTKSHPGFKSMKDFGYKDGGFLFDAYTQPGRGRVAVYRFYNEADKDWVTVSELYEGFGKMESWGYIHKEFLFYTHSEPGFGRIAVNNWWHERDRDWVLFPEDLYDDSTLVSWGYGHKRLEFYADRL